MRYFLLLSLAILGLSCTQATEHGNSKSNIKVVDEIAVTASSINKKFKKNQDNYLIHFESDFDDKRKNKYLLKYNIKIISKITKNKYLVTVTPNPGIEEIKKQIKQSKYIKYIQLNNEYHIK